MTYTSTFALLEVAPATYRDIKARLAEAGAIEDYLDGDQINMQGLAVVVEPPRTTELLPSIEHLLQFFTYTHLPLHLQSVSRPFCEAAHDLARSLPGNAETSACLRKLLEAKDCAVRATLARPPSLPEATG